VITETSQQGYQIINDTNKQVYVWIPAGLMAVRGCTAPAAERLSSACMVELEQRLDVVFSIAKVNHKRTRRLKCAMS
jgi:hypothetical protein